MSIKSERKTLLAASATALSAIGLFTAPVALADESCTVPGQYLNLFQPDGNYKLFISANGSALGPRGLAVVPGGAIGTYGNVRGGIQGRNVDFTITWDDNQGQAHFTGTVGDNGVAHGASSGPSVPINLWNPGPWDSTDPLTCPAAEAQAAKTATVKQDVDVFDQPDGVGTEYPGIILRVGRVLELVEPCRSDWCHLVIAEAPGGTGWVPQTGENGVAFLAVK